MLLPSSPVRHGVKVPAEARPLRGLQTLSTDRKPPSFLTCRESNITINLKFINGNR